MKLTDSQYKKLAHTLGYDYKDRSFRNYYVVTDVDEDFEDLIVKGLVEKSSKFDQIIYRITDKGHHELLKVMRDINGKRIKWW